jgi:glycosyltransferase involved in cell wall biosynthesis
MRILIITQYFWPENFKINSLSLELKNNGHEVFVLTGLPNYPSGKISSGYSFWKSKNETWHGIKIYRSKLIPRFSGKGIYLFFNYISFALFSSIKLLFRIKEKPDLIFVYEPSPVTVGIPALVAKNKFNNTPIFFWVQDLWPDSLKDTGAFNNKYILNAVDKLTRHIYNKSDFILVQSEAFIDYIIKQGVPLNKIKYFPNPTEKFYNVKKVEFSYSKLFPIGFNLIFAGNIGEAQSFDTLISAAHKLKQLEYPIFWNIFGDGRAKEQFSRRVIELNLEENFIFKGTYKSEEMPSLFACADALVVSLKKSKIFSLTIPAKVQSYLACGKPIIASIDGQGARIIQQAKAGLVSSSEDVDNLTANIIKLYNLTELERATLGLNGRKYFEKEFSMEILIDKLENIFKSKIE